MLLSKQHEIDFALDGMTAIEMIKKRLSLVYAHQGEMYKLILLDYSMPGMDGP